MIVSYNKIIGNASCVYSYLLYVATCYFLQEGETPLHVASLISSSWWSNDKVVEVLIKSGADVNITNRVSYHHASMEYRNVYSSLFKWSSYKFSSHK